MNKLEQLQIQVEGLHEQLQRLSAANAHLLGQVAEREQKIIAAKAALG